MAKGFDRSGSYRLVLLCFSLGTLVAVALISRLGPYQYSSTLSTNYTVEAEAVGTN